MTLGIRQPGFEFWLYCTWAVKVLISPCLRRLICKMGYPIKGPLEG